MNNFKSVFMFLTFSGLIIYLGYQNYQIKKENDQYKKTFQEYRSSFFQEETTQNYVRIILILIISIFILIVFLLKNNKTQDLEVNLNKKQTSYKTLNGKFLTLEHFLRTKNRFNNLQIANDNSFQIQKLNYSKLEVNKDNNFQLLGKKKQFSLLKNYQNLKGNQKQRIISLSCTNLNKYNKYKDRDISDSQKCNISTLDTINQDESSEQLFLSKKDQLSKKTIKLYSFPQKIDKFNVRNEFWLSSSQKKLKTRNNLVKIGQDNSPLFNSCPFRKKRLGEQFFKKNVHRQQAPYQKKSPKEKIAILETKMEESIKNLENELKRQKIENRFIEEDLKNIERNWLNKLATNIDKNKRNFKSSIIHHKLVK